MSDAERAEGILGGNELVNENGSVSAEQATNSHFI
jgi:hypothetical protein